MSDKETDKVSNKTTFTFGNFLVEVELSTEVPDALKPYVLDGCTQKLQRKPASAVEKALAGYDKRPKGFNRGTEIPFSAKGVSLIEATFGEAVSDVAIVSATEYIPSVGEIKYAREKAQIATSLAAGKTLEDITERIKFVGETTSDDDETEYSVAFLVAVKTFMANAL